MRFRFRKLYADLVADDGAVCIVYVSWLETWGLRVESAAVELYGPKGTREILRARAVAGLDPEQAGPDLRLRLELPEGRFLLRYEAEAGSWEPAPPADLDGLRWSVRAARARAVASWTGGRRRELHGLGYADAVALDRPPRSLGLERLDWGRAHLDGETVVFTRLSTRSGLEWARAARWRPGARQPDETDLDLEPRSRDLALRLHDGAPGSNACLRLRPIRTLHDGPAFDAARLPSPLARSLATALAGRVVETRWLSGAAWDDGACGGALAVHEHVRFGGGPPAVRLTSP